MYWYQKNALDILKSSNDSDLIKMSIIAISTYVKQVEPYIKYFIENNLELSKEEVSNFEEAKFQLEFHLCKNKELINYR